MLMKQRVPRAQWPARLAKSYKGTASRGILNELKLEQLAKAEALGIPRASSLAKLPASTNIGSFTTGTPTSMAATLRNAGSRAALGKPVSAVPELYNKRVAANRAANISGGRASDYMNI